MKKFSYDIYNQAPEVRRRYESFFKDDLLQFTPPLFPVKCQEVERADRRELRHVNFSDYCIQYLISGSFRVSWDGKTTILRGEKTGSVGKIIGQCRDKGAVVKEVDKKKLDFMCGHSNHQGVVAICAAHDYATVEEILAVAEERGEAPFIVACDGIEDPHNLGAIIRTAEAAGVHGIIIPKRRSASLNYTVGKTSAGALEYMKVARVSNLASTLQELKDKGMWVYGADMDGEDARSVNFDGAAVLVIGSEGDGMSRIVREKCDFIVSLKMKGQINSLNASVAGGILMYEISYKR